ncbi:MAG: tRNA (adenosine(37)-N6)-dimethylallyltransferase MiaA [Saprospiraceae bacterium]|nr:tRNA (adenosine(37)-N6)-dimethylallyltransferase MiaA [Saprospiraceae bacterium]MDW8230627.1 tRNA (adenosine(37)-N6)-dimethylallyltransferase MiaA [Saprospiraceae bacterium]
MAGKSSAKYLLVIGGPTAVGKTAVAVRLARHFDTAVLSADSRQFYREMSIGTAKPTLEERQGVPHYFIDTLSVGQTYSVGDFERDALAVLADIFRHKDVAVLVGGSGLYLQAVYAGLDAFPPISAATRARVRAGEAAGGLAWLQQQVAERDPDYFATADTQNPARLRRALEVCLESGQPFSSFRRQASTPRPFRALLVLLQLPRAELYARIEQRVDAMVAAGLEEEARALWPYRHLPALRTVGYEEWFDYFEGLISRQQAIEKIKQHTRNYAKRQETWFRKHGTWTPFHPDDEEGIIRWAEEKMTGQ